MNFEEAGEITHNQSTATDFQSVFLLKVGTSTQHCKSTIFQFKKLFLKSRDFRGDLQDGGGVRCGDHLPPHKYIRNTSTCGTTPTEHLLNAGRRPQTSQKAKNSPRTWVGQKKNRDKRIRKGPAALGGSCEGGKVSTHKEAPSWAETAGGGGGTFGATEESAATGVWRAKRRDSRTEDRCRAALTSPRGLSAHPPGRAGLGAEAPLRSDRRERTGVGGVNTA